MTYYAYSNICILCILCIFSILGMWCFFLHDKSCSDPIHLLYLMVAMLMSCIMEPFFISAIYLSSLPYSVNHILDWAFCECVKVLYLDVHMYVIWQVYTRHIQVICMVIWHGYQVYTMKLNFMGIPDVLVKYLGIKFT